MQRPRQESDRGKQGGRPALSAFMLIPARPSPLPPCQDHERSPPTSFRHCGSRRRVAATASVFFRRIFSQWDFCHYDPRGIAPGAVYLAAKVEETHLPMKLLFQSMHRIACEPPPPPGGGGRARVL